MARAIQLEMSHAQMDVSNRQMNAPNRVPLNISSVKTKVTADGAMVNGKIVHVLGTKKGELHAGTDTKIRRHQTVPTKIDRSRDRGAMLHQIVSGILKFYEKLNISRLKENFQFER